MGLMDSRRGWSWQRTSYVFVAVLTANAILVLYWFSRGQSAVSLRDPAGTDSDFGNTIIIPNLNEGSEGSTSAGCLSQFPDLYYEIDRAVELWKEKGHTISAEDVDISWQPIGALEGGAMRILIHKNNIRILESRNAVGDKFFRERGLGILHLLHRALEGATARGEVLPTIEAAIVLQDVSYPPTENGTHSFWTWARPYHDIHFNRTNMWEGEEVHFEKYWWDQTFQRVWLIPNFDLYYTRSIGYYEDILEQAKEHDAVTKIPKIVWRGTEWVNPEIRDVLVNVTKGKSWADVMYSDSRTNEHHLSINDMCKYAMTVHTEGFSYSGRLTHLLHCNSLPFVHELAYTTHYYHLLQASGPQQNYVAVKNDFSDLEEKVLFYLAHPDEAQAIISNHIATFRDQYLTSHATSCYLQRLIHQYATVAFVPAVTDSESNLRGLDFQYFVDYPEDFP
jgi:hypothetical protein